MRVLGKFFTVTRPQTTQYRRHVCTNSAHASVSFSAHAGRTTSVGIMFAWRTCVQRTVRRCYMHVPQALRASCSRVPHVVRQSQVMRDSSWETHADCCCYLWALGKAERLYLCGSERQFYGTHILFVAASWRL